MCDLSLGLAAAAPGSAACRSSKHERKHGPEPFTPESADALVAAVEAMGVGDPADEGTSVGPVINRHARDEVVDAAASVSGDGARVATGGRAPDGVGAFVSGQRWPISSTDRTSPR